MYFALEQEPLKQRESGLHCFVLLLKKQHHIRDRDKTNILIQRSSGIAGEKVQAFDSPVPAVICRFLRNTMGMMLVPVLIFGINTMKKCNPGGEIMGNRNIRKDTDRSAGHNFAPSLYYPCDTGSGIEFTVEFFCIHHLKRCKY